MEVYSRTYFVAGKKYIDKLLLSGTGPFKLSIKEILVRVYEEEIETEEELKNFLYEKGFHIISSDRRTILKVQKSPYGMIKFFGDRPGREVAYRRDGETFTGWSTGETDGKKLKVLSNTLFAETGPDGLKYVYVDIPELILFANYKLV